VITLTPEDLRKAGQTAKKVPKEGVREEVVNVEGLKIHSLVPANVTIPITLAFCPGINLGGEIFLPLMRALAARGYRSEAISYRGRPGSRLVSRLGNVSMSEYMQDVEDYLNARARQTVLCGLSMGEIVAGNVASVHRLVVGNISMASAPPKWVFPTGAAFRSLSLSQAKGILGKQPIFPTEKQLMKLFFNRMSPSGWIPLARDICYESPRVMREILTWKFDLPCLRIPSLVIQAAFDQMVRGQKVVARRLNASEWLEVPCQHVMTVDDNVRHVVDGIDCWMKLKFSDPAR